MLIWPPRANAGKMLTSQPGFKHESKWLRGIRLVVILTPMIQCDCSAAGERQNSYIRYDMHPLKGVGLAYIESDKPTIALYIEVMDNQHASLSLHSASYSNMFQVSPCRLARSQLLIARGSY